MTIPKILLVAGTGLVFCMAGSGQANAPAAQSTSDPGPPAQSPPAPPAQAQPADGPRDGVPPPPHGKVLFQSSGQPPEPDADRIPLASENASGPAAGQSATPQVTDADRTALTPTAYSLDVRLSPQTAHVSARAEVTLRNDGASPLRFITLQISSTLHWESATVLAEDAPGGGKAQRVPLAIAQHLLDTDADHTGKANEAVFSLPAPLGPGKTITLDTFYSGTIDASGARLERIGATHAQALASDWDVVSPDAVALRGFGNVLWYPVASPQLFLGDGAQLFQAIGRTRLRDESATIRLHLSVEYRGDPPVAVYFCGRRRDLKAISDAADVPVSSGTGIATADFPAEPLGFRSPNLFILRQAETPVAAPLAGESAPAQGHANPSSSSAQTSSSQAETEARSQAPALPAASGGGDALLAVETDDTGTLPALAASAQRVAPLLEEWFGPRPLSALTVLDHPGQPFEDGPLLVAPIASLAASTSAPALAHSLTHAWIDTGQPWFDEGLAEFVSLLWTERESGRAAAQSQLAALLQPLGPVEPSFDNPASVAAALGAPKPPGQPLIAASEEVYYRRKAAAVWWMLRGLTGDAPLRFALGAWRTQPSSSADAPARAIAFEKLLEKTSGKDLAWFFHDWVLNDLGLPDLSIADVTPRNLPAGQGHDSGWLVAVTVRNDGAAEAEVPVIVRSGSFSTTHRVRVGAFSSTTERVLTEAAPTEVVVNDEEVPEIRSSTHSRAVVLRTQ